MTKRIMMSIIVILSLTLLCSCGLKKEVEPREDAILFKQEYEMLNGKKNARDIPYRNVNIPENNPIYYASAEDIIDYMDEKETFYVYFGDTKCPWCRSTVEKMIEVASKNKIEKVYYVSIWDEEHNEILRDTYVLNSKNKPTLKKEGTKAYKELLVRFDSLLSPYTLTTSKGKKVEVGEKRIYAPNFVYVEKGKAIDLISGNSDKQKTSNEELTEEILKDEEDAFNKFFTRK